MKKKSFTKYMPFPTVELPTRQWPSKRIEKAPVWCSVDLRDGNQALAQPMSVEEKLEFFGMLVRIGFKEIEVGFPSASQIEFDFCRKLIEGNLIPEDVTIQILCQCREELIVRSMEAIRGAKRAIFHLYNSTSPYQRKYVFNASRDEVKAIAVQGAKWVRQHGAPLMAEGMDLRYQYSPESFNSTELDFAKEVCEAVMDVWEPTPERKVILNLPMTVEYATPNVHADQIEWMCGNLKRRDSVIISVHTHNDRGTGVAATELAMMAGAERVEGTLFGNGERTGNLDIVIVALNLHTQGVDPELDFGNLNEIREVYERCTRMEVHPRHPYAGELVFTAFSGSHQDAINKSWPKQKEGEPWSVLYITMDPADVGRSYKAIIRINSQSGKGGVAYVLETEFGYQLPKLMHKEIGKAVNDVADEKGTELSSEEILRLFREEYILRDSPLKLKEFKTAEGVQGVSCKAEVMVRGELRVLKGKGNGPIDAFVKALGEAGLPAFEVLNYSEHSLGRGAEARAVAYIQIKNERGLAVFGAGEDTSIERASINAVVSAVNRLMKK